MNDARMAIGGGSLPSKQRRKQQFGEVVVTYGMRWNGCEEKLAATESKVWIERTKDIGCKLQIVSVRTQKIQGTPHHPTACMRLAVSICTGGLRHERIVEEYMQCRFFAIVPISQ